VTASEFDEIAEVIDAAYRNNLTFVSSRVFNIWFDVIGKYDKESAEEAVKAWIKENQFPPKPSDIRNRILGSLKRPSNTAEFTVLFYWKEVGGHSYEHAAILVNDEDEEQRLKSAGYGGYRFVLRDSPSHRKLIEESERIRKKDKGNVQNRDLYNFRRDDKKS
jgi:hypothetical protein